MRVIVAPEIYAPQEGDVTCFLAGGITNCWEWQEAVINELRNQESRGLNLDHMVLFNPRRKNFPIDDPNASEEQIEWEFENLTRCDIFSMYFCADNSDQPICMYELGRNLALRSNDFDKAFNCVVTVEKGYRRENDVRIQMRLAQPDKAVPFALNITKPKEPQIHAFKIYEACENFMRKKNVDNYIEELEKKRIEH